MLSKKGQVAIEFFTYAGIFLMAIMAVLGILYFLYGSDVYSREPLICRYLGQKVSDVFYLTVEGGQGFSYNITLPKTIEGKPYLLYIVIDEENRENSLQLHWTGNFGEHVLIYNLPNLPLIIHKNDFVKADREDNKLIYSFHRVSWLMVSNTENGLEVHVG